MFFIDFRERGRVAGRWGVWWRERETWMVCLLHPPQLGMDPTTFLWMLQPTEPSRQGRKMAFDGRCSALVCQLGPGREAPGECADDRETSL